MASPILASRRSAITHISEDYVITLLGKHILGQQMALAFDHEHIPFYKAGDLSEALHTSGPVLLWDTNNRAAVAAGLRLRLSGRPVHRYWIGGDVLALRKMGAVKQKTYAAVARAAFTGQTATSAQLADELHELGIQSAAMPFGPICCRKHYPMKLPRLDGPYTVLHYSMSGMDYIYRPDILFRCAAAHPGIQFISVGNPDLRSELPNVRVLGQVPYLPMLTLYNDCHCLLRMTTHDGFPRMVLESLALGLDVVTTVRAPYTVRAETGDEAVSAVGRLAVDRQRNGAGREWYFANHSAQAWARYWTEHLEAAWSDYHEGGVLADHRAL